jgi:hypothetical protein
VDHVLISLGVTGRVVHIPTQDLEEGIDKLAAELGLVVGPGGICRKIFLKPFDQFDDLVGSRHDPSFLSAGRVADIQGLIKKTEEEPGRLPDAISGIARRLSEDRGIQEIRRLFPISSSFWKANDTKIVFLSPMPCDEFTAITEEPAESQDSTTTEHPLFAGSSTDLSRGRAAIDEEAGKHP